MNEAPPLVRWIEDSVRSGLAPTPDAIRNAAGFHQAGGIARLCEALAYIAERSVADLRRRA